MIRGACIDCAARLGIEDQLRKVRAALVPRYHAQIKQERRLRLLLRSILCETSNCIDVGAYRGRVLAEIIRAAPRGRHIAYEPVPESYRRLVRRFRTVDVRAAAVSNQVGKTTFVQVVNHPALSGLRERKLGENERLKRVAVRTEMLDISLPPGYVPDLIKIDVEGAERLVIEGGINTITEHKPVILFEHGLRGADYYDTDPASVFKLLHDVARLRVFDLDGNGPYTLGQFRDTYDSNSHYDFVARP